MTTNDDYGHVPVMPGETMTFLSPMPGETVLDGTVGLGGHSLLFGHVLGERGRLICFDRDAEALSRAKERLVGLACGQDFVHAPFERMVEETARLGVEVVDRIFLDLGVSSLQLDKPERGFSFMRDGPLDMRMDQGVGRSAADIVNTWSEGRLRELFFRLGEERFSPRLAKSIVAKRVVRPIETTGELAQLALAAIPRTGRIHPATRMFQALRMEVNDELGTLSRGLAAAGRVLRPGGRLGVLTFHSLEDRLVKRVFLRWRDLGVGRVITGKAVGCGVEEARGNRRARSAKLRVVERL